jgi:hypothetical protein
MLARFHLRTLNPFYQVCPLNKIYVFELPNMINAKKSPVNTDFSFAVYLCFDRFLQGFNTHIDDI